VSIVVVKKANALEDVGEKKLTYTFGENVN
jgi:hypothetical protein